MKTTLDINDQLLTSAKLLAAQQRTNLTRLIEDGLRMRLREQTARLRGKLRLHVFKGRGGLVAGVDPLLEQAAAAAAAGATLSLMPMVLASFLRLVTSPKIFQLPTPVDDAVGFVDALMAAPGVHLAPLGPEWTRLRQLCLDKQLTGNTLPDAWLAAATQHLGEHLVSFDRDFRKLLGRAWFTLLVPLAG